MSFFVAIGDVSVGFLVNVFYWDKGRLPRFRFFKSLDCLDYNLLISLLGFLSIDFLSLLPIFSCTAYGFILISGDWNIYLGVSVLEPPYCSVSKLFRSWSSSCFDESKTYGLTEFAV